MRARNKKEVSTLFAGSFVVRTIDINQLSLGIISDDPHGTHPAIILLVQKYR